MRRAADTPLIYWDACVFLSLLEETPGRIAIIQELASQADARKISIVTSTLSITEVAYTAVEKKGEALSDDEESAIDTLWSPSSPFTLLEFHSLQARKARMLMRRALEGGLSLKPNDAIHLAAAAESGVEQFSTYDERLDKFAGIAGFKIERPYASVLDFSGEGPEG